MNEQQQKGDCLSIIVPIYNGEKRIKTCIDSILNQTYENIELILIDDGSVDASYEIVRDVLTRIPSGHMIVKLIRQENHGVAYARNYGISIASGAYLTFIDQDDYVLPDYCEHYMRTAGEKKADIVIGGFERITDEGKVSRRVVLKPAVWSKFVVTAPWAHIYKTEFIRENKIQFLSTGLGEDIYFNLTAYAYTERIAIQGDYSYRWVDNPKSVSNSKQNFISEKRDPLFLLESLKKRLPKENKLRQEYEEYFFMRYIVWYFSFTVKGSSWKDIVWMYERLMRWLRENYPDYRKNPNISMFRPKGDSLFIRISVWLFYVLERMGMMPGAFKLLAKK